VTFIFMTIMHISPQILIVICLDISLLIDFFFYVIFHNDITVYILILKTNLL